MIFLTPKGAPIEHGSSEPEEVKIEKISEDSAMPKTKNDKSAQDQSASGGKDDLDEINLDDIPF